MKKIAIDEKYGGARGERQRWRGRMQGTGREGEAAVTPIGFRKKGKNGRIFLKTIKVSTRDHGLLLGVGVIPNNHIFASVK